MHSGFQARHIFRSSQMSAVAKLSWKPSTNGKSCPLVSPGMSTIYFDLFKTYLLCPHFLISSHLYRSASFGWKANYPNKSMLPPCHKLTKKKKVIPESWGQTADTGRRVSISTQPCVVLVSWGDSLFMWCFPYNPCFPYPSVTAKVKLPSTKQNKLLCLVVERSFPSAYYSLLRWVVKDSVLILMKIDSQREHAACLASLLDAQQRAWQTWNSGIACWFGD